MHVYQHKLLSQNQMDDKSLFLVLGCDHASVVKSSYKIHMAEGSRDIMELYFYHQQWKALPSEQLLSKLYISALLAHRGVQNGCWCKFSMLIEAILLKLTIKNMISFWGFFLMQQHGQWSNGRCQSGSMPITSTGTRLCLYRYGTNPGTGHTLYWL